MRPYWQKDWFGIDFKSFSETKLLEIADLPFYGRFYQKFFQIYPNLESVPENFKNGKQIIANLIESKIKNRDPKVLGVAVGLGLVEAAFSRKDIDLYVLEDAPLMADWLKVELSNTKVLNDLEGKDEYFDDIYLVALDYVFDDPSLISYLDFLSSSLKSGGSIHLVSSSYEEASLFRVKLRLLKDFAFSFFSGGQLWGYIRTESDFKRVFSEGGFSLEDVDKSIPHQIYFRLRSPNSSTK